MVETGGRGDVPAVDIHPPVQHPLRLPAVVTAASRDEPRHVFAARRHHLIEIIHPFTRSNQLKQSFHCAEFICNYILVLVNPVTSLGIELSFMAI